MLSLNVCYYYKYIQMFLSVGLVLNVPRKGTTYSTVLIMLVIAVSHVLCYVTSWTTDMTHWV
jgi:hypothetical protein